MLWGCITSEGVGKLVKIDGIMNAKKYMNVLSDGLIKTIEKFSLKLRNVIFYA
jgi:hypothetical protein